MEKEICNYLFINVCSHSTSDKVHCYILFAHIYTMEEYICVTIYVPVFFQSFNKLFHMIQISLL